MNLSLRLESLLSELSLHGGCKLLFDVGCDHGYTAIEAVKRGISERAVAADINKGPLSFAASNIELSGLGKSISTKLSDGLKDIETSEIGTDDSCLLISGMGGELITRIISYEPDKLKRFSKLILSPQSEPELCRHFLCERSDFNISDELYVKDEGKYYVIIYADKRNSDLTSDQNSDLTSDSQYRQIDYLFGRPALINKDPVLLEYLYELKKRKQAALRRSRLGVSEKASEQSRLHIEMLNYIEEAISCFQKG